MKEIIIDPTKCGCCDRKFTRENSKIYEGQIIPKKRGRNAYISYSICSECFYSTPVLNKLSLALQADHRYGHLLDE